MKYYYIILCISVFVILICAYSHSIKEGLTTTGNKDATIILLGDSILDNSNYVPPNKSVPELLKKKSADAKVFNFAKDESTINDVYSQLDNVSSKYNKPNVYIFLSAGGNNILNNKGSMTDAQIEKLSDEYVQLIKSIKTKLPNIKLNVLNLYLPVGSKYIKYHKSVSKWNESLNQSSNEPGQTFNVIDIFSLLTKSEDFVYDIEPSESGGEKIADTIFVATM